MRTRDFAKWIKISSPSPLWETSKYFVRGDKNSVIHAVKSIWVNVEAKSQSSQSVIARQIDEVLSDLAVMTQNVFQEREKTWKLLANLQNAEIRCFK